ncbi:penicillin-binding protein [Niallia sp. XMNu-256]|uniref:penicillin-binding protein n=1 Tax=Niallia sp. XMNu-256 TaxID=3082444 RepID=UPI0030D2401B
MIKKQRNINLGAAALFALFSLLFFVLFLRFLIIQTTGEVKGQTLAAKAEQMYSESAKIDAKRGTIYDNNGEVIAEDRSSYSLIAILSEKMSPDPEKPNHVVDLEKTASELAKFIDLPKSDIYKILKTGKDNNRFQVEFGSAGRDISLEAKEKIEDLKLPGISFSRSMKRFYPNGVFASHVIGYTENKLNEDKKNETVGMMGIEKSLNSILTGKDGSYQFESDIWGFLLPNGEEKITPAQDGKSVYLTLDQRIQIMLEDTLNKVDQEYNPKKMVAIVANAKTGEILGMGQRPTFNPETKEGLEGSWYNEAIELPFEPGSTMKIFTLAAAVEEGVFNPNEQFMSGQYVIDQKSTPISDHNGGRGWGTISYLEGVQRSSNVLFTMLANEKLGFDKLEAYLKSFGITKLTGIDLPNEKPGKFLYNYPREKATTAYGQGTTVTPIQLVQGATAIANDGKMMQTHVIDKVIDPDTGKTIKDTKPEVIGKPISEETAAIVRDYLGTVITGEHGTGKRYAIDGYEVAGKTGTAQIPSKSGGYLRGPTSYVYSFIGMAPKDDPELIVYVSVQEPDSLNYGDGSKAVSEIFKPVMKNSLQYLQVEPSDNKTVTKVTNPDLEGQSVQEAKQELSRQGLEAIVIGNGSKVTSQIPAKSEVLMPGEKVVLKTDGDLIAPDMTGWSLRDVMKVAKAANMKLNSVGNGFVVKQNFKPGSMMREEEFLIVDLDKPGVITQEPIENSEIEEEQTEKETVETSNEGLDETP